MKKLFLVALLFVSLIIIKVNALNRENVLYLNDVTTKNFVAKVGYLRLSDIKMLCLEEYCDYMDGATIYAGLENFSSKYLKTLDDDEIIATLKIKGIKITKIVLQN